VWDETASVHRNGSAEEKTQDNTWLLFCQRGSNIWFPSLAWINYWFRPERDICFGGVRTMSYKVNLEMGA